MIDDPERGGIPGSFGSIPIPVSRACQNIADEVEANPDGFMRLMYDARRTRCRERIVELIGARVDECVLIPNATHGINTVLWNIDWKKGDVIVQSAALIAFSVRGD